MSSDSNKKPLRRRIESFTARQVLKIISKVPYPVKKWYYVNRYVPRQVRLEASTVCQLRCAGCTFQNSDHDGLGLGFLTFENFKRFVDDNPFVQRIELSNYGEIFLNPELVDMMRYARKKKVRLTCENGTNFNTVTEEQMRTMVETGFGRINLSIDGASQETYSKYRRGGNFDTVIANVRRLQEIKRELNSKDPELHWQFVLNEFDELDAGKAVEMAKELGIGIYFKRNWDPAYRPQHTEYLEKVTGMKFLTNRELTPEGKKSASDHYCQCVFELPQINWDGRLLGCYTARNAAFDVNVFESGLKKALRSKRYKDMKSCLLTLHPDRERYADCMCIDCRRRNFREKRGTMLDI